MDITSHEIIHKLEVFGKACIDLSEQMADSGRPLNRDEASLVRQAMLGWVEDIMEEMKISYMIGSPRIKEDTDRLVILCEAVSDITR